MSHDGKKDGARRRARCMWLTGTVSGGPTKGLGEAELGKRKTHPRKLLGPEPAGAPPSLQPSR